MKKYSKSILEYFQKENLSKYCKISEGKTIPGSLDVFKASDSFFPELDDLVRLHKIIRTRKIFTILEFGVGFSTVIMADALSKNKYDFENLEKKPDLRNTDKFKIFSVDTSEYWIQKSKKLLGKNKTMVEFQKSRVHIGTFNDRICHYYDKLPAVIPDMIYLDGPHKFDIEGNLHGLDFKSINFTAIAGDLLRMEPVFLPGTYIIIDGRTNNARFLKNNFQRNWEYNYDEKNDISTFELIEKPLGHYNKMQLEFCLGKSYFKKLKSS